MKLGRVFYVGAESEVAHHAAPLQADLHVEITEPRQVVSAAEPGDLAIFFSEHFQRFRDAVTELKRKRVATLYCIDGILEWRNSWENTPLEPACPWTMRPVLSHKVACIGRSQKRVLDSWGNSAKTELVGLPRLDVYSKAEISSRSNVQNSPFRILLMTAKCPGFTPEQVATTRRSLLDLKQWFDRNKEIGGQQIEVVWRLTAELDVDLGIRNSLRNTFGMDLANQLREVDAVITTPSTSMLEGMLAGKPVALLDYHNTPQLVPAVWTISAPGHIEQVVRELITPPEAKRQFQSTLLADALECTSPALPRLLDLTRMMLEEASIACSQERDLFFAPGMLAANDFANGSTFDSRALFPQYSDFHNEDLLELQAELAQAKRQIAHLQSHLDQAHAVFDQIKNHPVAGPIVRTREKLLKWFETRKRRRQIRAEARARAEEPAT